MMKRYLTILVFLLPLIAVFGTEGLQQEIDKAIAAGKKQIVLKEREYRVAAQLSLHDLDGIVIDGNGAPDHPDDIVRRNRRQQLPGTYVEEFYTGL